MATFDRSVGSNVVGGEGYSCEVLGAYAAAMSRCAEAGWSADGFVRSMAAVFSVVQSRRAPSVAQLGRVCSVDRAVGESGIQLGENGCAVEQADYGDGSCGGGDDGIGSVGSVTDSVGVKVDETVRGKHYLKNKSKRDKRKRMATNWRSGDTPSVATVCTVDTRTAVEMEAAQTLAARRVAENKVAEALAEHKLRALKDKDRTVMVDRLAAARGEQRINEAKAKSQASFKQCDQSLRSLGSSGSAGEFALKQEVKKAKDNEALRLYVEKQAQMFAKYATPDVLQMVAAIPAPVLQDEFEAFGECPSEYGEDEQEAYFDELNRRNEENFDRCATYC